MLEQDGKWVKKEAQKRKKWDTPRRVHQKEETDKNFSFFWFIFFVSVIEQRNLEDVHILYRSNKTEMEKIYEVKTYKSQEIFKTSVGVQMLLPSKIGITLFEKLFRFVWIMNRRRYKKRRKDQKRERKVNDELEEKDRKQVRSLLPFSSCRKFRFAFSQIFLFIFIYFCFLDCSNYSQMGFQITLKY